MGSQRTPVLEERAGEAGVPGPSPPALDMSAPSSPKRQKGRWPDPPLGPGQPGQDRQAGRHAVGAGVRSYLRLGVPGRGPLWDPATLSTPAIPLVCLKG